MDEFQQINNYAKQKIQKIAGSASLVR